MRRLALILLLALPGCLSTPVPPCAEGPCETGPAPPVPELPGMVLEGCRGVQAMVHVPEASARDAVGPSFVPEGDLPMTALLLLEPLDCGRVVTPHSVHADVGLLWVSLNVRPANGSWSHARASSFVLEVLSTDQAVAQALADLGMPAQAAQLERGTGPASGAVLGRTFRTSTAAYGLTWGAAGGSGAPAPAYDRDFWSPSTPARRLDARETDATSFPGLLAPGALRLEGAPAARGLLDADTAPFLSYVLDESRWELIASPQRFEVSA